MVSVNVAKAEKISWIAYAEIKSSYRGAKGGLMGNQQGNFNKIIRNKIIKVIKIKKIELNKEEIKNIIDLYKECKNLSEVGRLFKLNRKVVRRILLENNIEIRDIKQHRVWLKEEDIDNIVKLYKEGNSSDYIATLYNCEGTLIRTKLRERNVKLGGRERCNLTKYSFDTKFFKIIDTEEKAYWLGFILADGCVYKKHLTIGLSVEDIDMLYKFRKSIEGDFPVKIRKNGTSCEINLGSSELYRDLINLGIIERKTFNLDFYNVLCNVPHELQHHFLRGIFDGDGCIKKYRQTHYKDKIFFHFSITGLYDVVNWSKNFLNINNNIIKEKRSKNQMIHYCITRKTETLINIRNILYKDANIFMERKYNIFKEI